MRSLSLLVVTFALGLATACEEQDSCTRALEVDTHLEIGEGEQELTLIENLDRVPVSQGSQGGNHIWIGVRTSGIAPGRRGTIGRAAEAGPDIVFDLLDSTGARIGDGGVSETPLVGDELEADLIGAELFVDSWEGDNDGGEESDEEALYTLRATLLDRCGTELIAERQVYLDW